MLPRDFASGPLSDGDRVIAFCGHCAHFEVSPLGGGGECHKGHDCADRTATGSCADHHELARGSGPLFDLSE